MLYDIYELPDHMGFTETPFYNKNFCIVDYCSLGYADALGSIAVIIIVTIIYWVGVYLIMLIAEKTDLQNKWRCCKPIRKRKGCCGMWRQDRYSIGNAIVRLLLENYITLLVAGGVAWYAKKYFKMENLTMNRADKINYWSGITTLGIAAIFTLLMFYLVFYEFRFQIDKEESANLIEDTQRRIDTLEHIRQRRKKRHLQKVKEE